MTDTARSGPSEPSASALSEEEPAPPNPAGEDGEEARSGTSAPAGATSTGTYELLRRRLAEQARDLAGRARKLNEARVEAFGSTEMALVGNVRLRTANNCVARDVTVVGDLLLFGYNVFIGLRTETSVDDVFSLRRVVQLPADGEAAQGPGQGQGHAQQFELHDVAADDPANFLTDKAFVADFAELFRYYKGTKLVQLRRVEGRLLAVFQTGRTEADLKVFRWAVDSDGNVRYMNDRGEREHVFPPAYDFEWQEATRDDHVAGRFPHVNVDNQVFVETVGGTLTIKVENNTETGEGIYSEPVDQPTQGLADADIHYARLGPLTLLRIRPYKEPLWRHLVYNAQTDRVHRVDAIGQACQQLPEDHGLVFPGGYYLRSGELKTFGSGLAAPESPAPTAALAPTAPPGDAGSGAAGTMIYLESRRSPNGEDVIYAFHDRVEGRTVLLPYNLIRKEVAQLIICHGYGTFDDGTMVLFREETGEPTRIHPMQVWRTPYVSDEHAAQQTGDDGSFLHVLGNADLVRAISDSYSLERSAVDDAESMASYEDLVARATRMQDAYHWLDDPQVGDLATPLRELRGTAELVIDEFEKVEALRREARAATDEAASEMVTLRRELAGRGHEGVKGYVESLGRIRKVRGRLVSLEEMRYADLERIGELEAEASEAFDALAGEMIEFVLADGAFDPFHDRIGQLEDRSRQAGAALEVAGLVEELGRVAEQMALLTEVIEGLHIEDATERTRVLQTISEVLAAVNRARAVADGRRRALASTESAAEFSAQVALLGEAVSSALSLAHTPEDCDDQLARLLSQVEGLEARFGEVDAHLEQLATRRDDIYEAFTSRKQALVDERQRHADRLVANADRVLETIGRRAAQLETLDEVNAYFVADPMVDRLRSLATNLRELGDGVRADELDGRLVSARQEAGRTLRDRRDLFDSDAQVIRLGDHRFTVNTQPIDLTVVPHEDRLDLAVTGTDYRERLERAASVDTAELEASRPYWEQRLVSETKGVYRAEYLATLMLADAEAGVAGLSIQQLGAAAAEGDLLDVVRQYAAERYDEGYERGVHDHDAAKILDHLVRAYETADLLRWSPRPRALACLFWAFRDRGGLQTSTPAGLRTSWKHRARSLARLREAFSGTTVEAIHELQREMAAAISARFQNVIDVHPDDAGAAGAYLFEELAQPTLAFATSAQAVALRDALLANLAERRQKKAFKDDLAALDPRNGQDGGTGIALAAQWQLVHAWLQGLLQATDDPEVAALAPDIDEAAILLLTETSELPRATSSALRSMTVSGLVGNHPRILDGAMELRLDEMLDRTGRFRHERVPGFRQWMALREQVLDRARRELRISELRPKVMSAFVRNQLVDKVYLPLIGANLARQLGEVGPARRTDQSGLLMLISPPGYGKTTLMEYIASRLGLVFVKVNGPALGASVTSVDPGEAPNATARQEVEKISFALEMGNNVLLYLDDIQHTSPELLQKFISLCDAQRRMEGVWRDRTRTYDLRGKRFAVCMAGNPYTESGHRFRVPDMLANRADVYNLGDVLTGREDLFALSYVENALTANPVLAPLAGRDLADVPLLVRMSEGEEVPSDRLSHAYTSVELTDVMSVLRIVRQIQATVMRVNAAYIASASQDDAFRSEPPFLLQGSYRDMIRMTEKVVPGMTSEEVEALIDDHYQSESQTLTSGAEHNLLKLAELRGRMTEAEAARWADVKRGFARVQATGGDNDPMSRVVGQLGLIGDQLGELANKLP